MYQISNFQSFITDELVYGTKLYDKSILGMYTLLFLRADKNNLLILVAFSNFKVIVKILPTNEPKRTLGYKRLLVKKDFLNDYDRVRAWGRSL